MPLEFEYDDWRRWGVARKIQVTVSMLVNIFTDTESNTVRLCWHADRKAWFVYKNHKWVRQEISTVKTALTNDIIDFWSQYHTDVRLSTVNEIIDFVKRELTITTPQFQTNAGSNIIVTADGQRIEPLRKRVERATAHTFHTATGVGGIASKSPTIATVRRICKVIGADTSVIAHIDDIWKGVYRTLPPVYYWSGDLTGRTAAVDMLKQLVGSDRVNHSDHLRQENDWDGTLAHIIDCAEVPDKKMIRELSRGRRSRVILNCAVLYGNVDHFGVLDNRLHKTVFTAGEKINVDDVGHIRKYLLTKKPPKTKPVDMTSWKDEWRRRYLKSGGETSVMEIMYCYNEWAYEHNMPRLKLDECYSLIENWSLPVDTAGVIPGFSVSQ